ncbi:MAG: transglutaminase domain-containing protein, partial [Pirellulales bacterium]|nr:transglutaminase domain-containing protein [Pirellulales bacterium]
MILAATMFVGCSATSFAELPKFVGKRSRPHQIVSRASQSVRTQLSREVFFPQMAVQAYSMTAAVPPDHDGQRLVSFDTDGQVDRIDDKTDPSRKLVQQFERISRPVSPSRFRFEVTMVLDLFERRLVKRSDQHSRAQHVVDKHLPTRLRERFLRADDFFDYQSSAFQQWKDQSGLSATSDQTEMEFARRVFDKIATDYRYSYDFKQDRAASSVCQSRATDCGGLSILFATVLRSEGIPARTLVGHFAESLSKEMGGREEPQGSRHVIAEFFADGIGWVPVDLASAILSISPRRGKEHFGNQIKPFVTLHFDHQIGFDSQVWGEKTENFFQFPRLWFRGKGP